MENIWPNLKKPLIGQAPMDGVSDASFRFITDKFGHPDMLFTEFVSVEGISRSAVKLLNTFIHHKTNTPTIAQLYGTNPQNFYNAAFTICELGFSGIDINMGCPDASITNRGGGAALILNSPLARKIISSVKKASRDYADGRTIDQVQLPQPIVQWIKTYNQKNNFVPVRKKLPVSVKTRIGYDKTITKDWINALLEAEPAVISLHARTLKQMYTGLADWDEIGKAAEIIKSTKTFIFGNGDIKSAKDAKMKIEKYKLDGALIGRASLGNPWVFQDYQATDEERIKTAIEHCEVYMKFTPQIHFVSLRKHLGWYIKGIEGSHKLRNQLMKVNDLKDVKKILTMI